MTGMVARPAAEQIQIESVRPRIQAQAISHGYRLGEGWLPVLQDVSISAADGEFATLIGPSGCGKSTLFALLAGLIAPDSGRVLLDGQDVTGSVGHVALMPQKDLLLPWKTVLDNAALGLELRGVSRKEARREALGWFPRFGLTGFERQYPSTLSGGMRQRAAFLRTLLTGREVLLLDEPFGALDALTRLEMQRWLLDVWSAVSKTVVLITHDVDESIYLSDRVYVMSSRPGRIASCLQIPFSRPRAYEDLVADQTFSALKAELLGLLRKEIS